MHSPELARPTCLPSPGSSCKRSPSPSCSSFAFERAAHDPLIAIVGLTMLGYAVARGLGAVRRAVDRHDADVLPGRHRPTNGTPSQHAVTRRAADPGHQPDVPVRRRLPALVSGDRRRLSGSCRLRVPWCVTFSRMIRGRWFGPRSPLDDLERLLETRWRRAMRRARGAPLRRDRRVDGRMACGAAAGRLAVPSRLTHRNPLEYPAHPAHLDGPVAGGLLAGLVGAVGTAGCSAGVDRRTAY